MSEIKNTNFRTDYILHVRNRSVSDVSRAALSEHDHSIGSHHLELHPMSRGYVQRKYPRLYLGRLGALVSQQALQRLERRARVKHLHGIAVPEGMQCNRDRERHAVRDGLYGLVQPSARCAIGDFPGPYLLRPVALFIPSLERNAQGGAHHLQLGHVLRV